MISVVVCTYNRADLLEICLETLIRQDATPGSYEIIVVDNNSADSTREVTESLAQRSPHLRYVFEPKQGLSNARNCGAAAAQGEYIAYVDDECKIPPRWIAAAQALVAGHAPAIAGGPYAPWYRDPRPVWFKDSYAGIATDGAAAGPLGAGKFVSGGNMLVRKDVLEALGGFDPAFGMSGGKIGYGEETSLQLRLRADRPDALIYFDPALLLYHVVRPEKMRLGNILHSHFAGGRDWSRVTAAADTPRPKHALNRLAKVVAASLLLAWHSSVGALLRDRAKFPYAANYLVERAFRYGSVLGAQLELLRNSLLGRGRSQARRDVDVPVNSDRDVKPSKERQA